MAPRTARGRASSAVRRRRAKPGARGSGKYFHIEVRPRSDFVAFRNHDVGRRGGIERVAGRRASGGWATQKWLIGKGQAHRAGRTLVGDTQAARRVLAQLGAAPRHLGGDRFVARPRRNVPERAKPTPAMRRARRINIVKAQAAVRRKRRGTRSRRRRSA
ncbi:MAG: hypothetical protein IRY89_05705 [Pseudolabrys sp.]|nr:hypothetical protein [Pseudolabrys sp.]